LFPSHGGPPSREELAPHSSEAWPDEALERGLPRPFAKKREKLGEGKFSLSGQKTPDQKTLDKPEPLTYKRGNLGYSIQNFK
jgi:hypothetical protein